MRKIPAPSVNPENKPFFDAAASGKFLLKFCNACRKPHHYPRSLCPHCFSDRTEWREAKGTGTVYTYSVLKAVQDPYCIAYVTLDEGVTVLTNLTDCDFDKVKVGMKVKAVFKPAEGGASVPMFTPA
jgi:uncharacterized OB-fold protein